MKETIRNAIAWTGLLCAYADAMESGECPACEALDADVSQDGREVLSPLWEGDTCRNCGATFLRAGAGEDWDNMTPEVDDATALAWADRVVVDFENRNGRSLVDIGEAWDTAVHAEAGFGDTAEFVWSDDGAERFGHCVAMEYLGHGVGLTDDVRHGTPYDRPTSGDIDLDRWEIDFAPFREGETLAAFDDDVSAVFVDSDGDAGAYSLRTEGSGIGNSWAYGVGFEFYSSAPEELARIRAADTGAAFRGERVKASLRRATAAEYRLGLEDVYDELRAAEGCGADAAEEVDELRRRCDAIRAAIRDLGEV